MFPLPRWTHVLIVVGVMGLVFVADLTSKQLVCEALAQHRPTWLVDSVVAVDRVQHTGPERGTSIAAGVLGTLLMLAILVVAERRLTPSSQLWTCVACGVAWGGILANNIDRVVRGTVTDWLRVQVTPSYNIVVNIADVAIAVGGAAGLAIVAFGLTGQRRRQARGNNQHAQRH